MEMMLSIVKAQLHTPDPLVTFYVISTRLLQNHQRNPCAYVLIKLDVYDSLFCTVSNAA